jgi:formylglycine-generating enzyme required for sulfatase activity
MKSFMLLLITACFLLSILSCATPSKGIQQVAGSDEAMVVVPKGWFNMGYDQGEFNETPEHEVFLKAFSIDRYEVPAKEFAAFLNEKGNPEGRYFSCDAYSTIACLDKEDKHTERPAGGSSVYKPRPGYENYPANDVSWFGADNFCRWKGKRLPTEAEWEKAARGEDSRLYPWGDSLPDGRTSRFGTESEKKGLSVLLPVDSLPDGRSYYGLYNMAGNVVEWTSDWYRQNYCNFCDPDSEDYIKTASELLGLHDAAGVDKKNPDVPPMYNSEGPPLGSFKVLRGGSWNNRSEVQVRTVYRYWLEPNERDNTTGFRCAK